MKSIALPLRVFVCDLLIMFVNVRKMVSIFESKKQPRPLSLPPCEQTQRENEKTSLTSEPSPAPSAVCHRPRPHAGERVRDAGRVRRVCDSWPGMIDYYPRANCLAVSIETKEPISSKHSPCIPSKNTISGLRTFSTSKQEQMCLSTETHIAPPDVNPGSSCVSDQKCQNPVWSSLTSSVRAERGGANTHTRKPRPSDATLLSLLLFFHR